MGVTGALDVGEDGWLGCTGCGEGLDGVGDEDGVGVGAAGRGEFVPFGVREGDGAEADGGDVGWAGTLDGGAAGADGVTVCLVGAVEAAASEAGGD